METQNREQEQSRQSERHGYHLKPQWNGYFRLGVTVFLIFLAVTYWKPFMGTLKIFLQAVRPLLMGCVVAYIINILMNMYERHFFPKSGSKWVHKMRRPVCMLGAFLTVVVIVVALLTLVIPELVSCIQVLLGEVPAAVQNLTDSLDESVWFHENLAPYLEDINWQDTFDKVVKMIESGAGKSFNAAAGAAMSFVSSALNWVVAVIFSMYLLLGREKLQRQSNRVLRHYLKPAWEKKLRYVLNILNDCFRNYIIGQCTEAVILGVLCMIGMFIFRFPYAAMTGAVIGMTALIPVAGAYIGGAVGFLLILTISPVKAVLFVIYISTLQQLEGNLIYPRVVGSSLGLPGIWVLAAVTAGGGVYGIPGMLLGVPLAAALYRMLREDMRRRDRIAAV